MVNTNDLEYEYRIDSLRELIRNDLPDVYAALQ
jgi:hypothetical protein